MNPRPVALLAALLPVLAVHLTYVLAASHGLVPWCIPYLDSCASISATGRHPPASYLFRATMLPAAVIFVGYWWLTRAWLRALGSPFYPRGSDWMWWLGLAACAGLAAYVTVLGEAGRHWQEQRRVGIVFYFAFTFMAQLLLSGELQQRSEALPWLRPYARVLMGNCVILLSLGLATVVWDLLDPLAYDRVEDAIEWILALLLQVNYLIGYLLWRRDGWHLEVVRAPRNADNPEAPARSGRPLLHVIEGRYGE
jgi:hypothetical protein